ncbi:hypothetical protein GOBAR_AA24788 [Gossypium barbadense]|uniref:Uncharacterized protein n=1 Tax=Gossypium barbadense TaxID=3634 RepID=A0A2P5WXY9_GOSBA|nr:hypothetical protein GOBAR_AA24788 [Gossypium barbadense]
MLSSQGKKTAVPASKKRKGALSSAGPTTKICHPLFQFPRGPQEELFQILRARALISGRYINWATIEQVQLADAIRALLTTNPWELFFGIIEPTFLKLIRQLSVLEFGTTLGLYTEEFKEENKLHALTRHIHFSPSKCCHTLALGAASYNPSCSKASVLPLSLRYLHAILAQTISGRRDSTSISGIGRGSSPLAPMLLGWLTLLAPQHCSPRIILNPHWPDVSQGISSMLSMRMIEKTKEPTLLNIVLPNLPRRRPTRTFLMMSLHNLSAPPHLIASPASRTIQR